MAIMLMHFELGDYDEWKAIFDSDPGGRKAVANGHRILRSVDNQKDIFLSVEHGTPDDARAVLDRLRQAGLLDRYPPKTGPAITEVVEELRH